MSETLLAFLSDTSKYVLLAVAGWGILHFYIKKRIESGVSHQFDLRLEDHKQSLRLSAEAARYDYEHRLSKANLYAQNRHDAALEVYRALRIAHGLCVNLRGIQEGLTFEEFNRDDLVDYMESLDVPKGKQEEILGRLESDRAGAIADMQRYLRILQVHEAHTKLGEAKNKSFLNELYFDDQVITAINKFISIMDKWMLYIRFPPDRHERKDIPTGDKMFEALHSIHSVLRDRLSGEGEGLSLQVGEAAEPEASS